MKTKKETTKKEELNEKEVKKTFNSETAEAKKDTKSFGFIVKSASKSITKEWLAKHYSDKSGHFRSEMLRICGNKKVLFSIFEKYQEKVNGVFVSLKEIKEGYKMSDAMKARWLQEAPVSYEIKGFASAIKIEKGDKLGVINLIKKDGAKSFYIFRKENFAVSDVIEAAKRYVLAGCPNFNHD